VLEWKEEVIGLGFEGDDALFPEEKYLSEKTHKEQSVHVSPMSSTHAVSTAFRTASSELGKSFLPHSAKHFIGILGLKVCKSAEELKAWSVNIGHEDEEVTRRYYQNITDDRVVEIFEGFGDEAVETVDDMNLMLSYHEHGLDRGTPEFERARRLVTERQERALSK
jgi:hypothetical protein